MIILILLQFGLILTNISKVASVSSSGDIFGEDIFKDRELIYITEINEKDSENTKHTKHLITMTQDMTKISNEISQIDEMTNYEMSEGGKIFPYLSLENLEQKEYSYLFNKTSDLLESFSTDAPSSVKGEWIHNYNNSDENLMVNVREISYLFGSPVLLNMDYVEEQKISIGDIEVNTQIFQGMDTFNKTIGCG